ncbi:MAG: DUF3553 domain-containing protein [Alphaproteobacteria bacterium]
MTGQGQHGLTPGVYVRNAAAPDWGDGQVQSAIGNKVTVNFEHCGKVVIDTSVVPLQITDPSGD